MFIVATSTLVALAGLTAAQVTINVGGPPTGPFIFTPANVTASNDTVVTFIYSGSPGNHSVTQSSFASPCEPLPGGFDSGNIFIPPSTADGFPSWNLTITDDSRPIWFFCKQLAPQTHCEAGMVGAINAPADGTNTFDAFVAAAEAQTGPAGQDIGGLVGVGASASALPGPLTGSITGFGLPNPTATSPSSSDTGTATTSTGASTDTGNGAAPMVPSAAWLAVAALFGVVLA